MKHDHASQLGLEALVPMFHLLAMTGTEAVFVTVIQSESQWLSGEAKNLIIILRLRPTHL